MIFEILVIILLILLNGLFAMSEMAVVSSRRGKLQALSGEGHKGAEKALKLNSEPGTFLSTVQIGITLIGILAGAFSGATISGRLEEWLDTIPALSPFSDLIAIIIVVSALTYLSLIIGELVPKQFALRNPEIISSSVSPFFMVLSRICGPLVKLIDCSSGLILKLLRINDGQKSQVSQDEIKALIAEGAETGIISQSSQKIFEGVFNLGKRPVRSAMTPRTEITYILATDSPEQMLEKIHSTRHSRFPVAEGSEDNITGIVSIKDLLPIIIRGETPQDWQEITQQPMILPENSTILNALEKFKQTSSKMAFVVDEYGSFEGILTIRDVLESIVGLIPDYTEDEPVIIPREDGSWIIDGMLSLDEVENCLVLKNMRGDEDFHTLAGFITHQLQKIPSEGEHFSWSGYRFEVVDMDGKRIDKVLVNKESL